MKRLTFWKNQALQKIVHEKDIVNGSLINLFDMSMKQSNTKFSNLQWDHNQPVLPGLKYF